MKEEIIKIVIDKGLIGLLLIVAGYLINRILEKHKSKQSLHNELAKMRISKIGECWEVLFKADSLARQLITVASDGLRKFGNENWSEYVEYLKKNTPLIEQELRKELDASHSIIEKNRFWIGHKSYHNFHNYTTSIDAYVDAFIIGDSKELMRLKQDMESRRESVVDLYNDITKEK